MHRKRGACMCRHHFLPEQLFPDSLAEVQGDKLWCTGCWFEITYVAEFGSPFHTANATLVKPERVWRVYYLANALDLKKRKRANLNLFFPTFSVTQETLFKNFRPPSACFFSCKVLSSKAWFSFHSWENCSRKDIVGRIGKVQCACFYVILSIKTLFSSRLAK